MLRIGIAFTMALTLTVEVKAAGLLIPDEKTLPPLAMLNHNVSIKLEDQAAVTRVEQTFRNHTNRVLEATYLFPVPKGASVNRFTMWVDGKEVKGELLEAKKARDIYDSIVRRTQDPGLLEYVENDLFRMKVFPVPANGDQKVSLSYTSISSREGALVEYVYPLKTDGKATSTLDKFTISASVISQHGIQNVYSPSHTVSIKRKSDKEVEVQFDQLQGVLDRDFQLFYQLGEKDVGLTALLHRPIASENGFSLVLINPKMERKDKYQNPRDMVFVLDTSGSMRGTKMDQARKAMKYCLNNLNKSDRFSLISFATTVNRYRDTLVAVEDDQLTQARKWVDDLEPTGGTAIYDALESALDLRPKSESGRTFTIVFFTDGQPTIGEGDKTKPEAILRNTVAKNSANTRIFTFGVGDDVNATLLDQVAEQTRALSTYVRPQEDIENKTSGLFAKISNPILSNLKLACTGDVSLQEVFPPKLPDLFDGGQLVVLARFSGKGPAAIKLTGKVGSDSKEFVYETIFPERTGEKESREFVEHLWARRKVGYLLDQIRVNGEKKELVDEVVVLAKRYGITTPYTSYLVVPDTVIVPPRPTTVPGGAPVAPAVPNVRFGPDGKAEATTSNPGFGLGGGGFQGGFGGGLGGIPAALEPAKGDEGKAAKPAEVVEFARYANQQQGQLGKLRDGYTNRELEKKTDLPGDKDANRALYEARQKKEAFDDALRRLQVRDREGLQAGRSGVDLSIQTANLKNQNRVERVAMRQIQGRNLMEVGGVWIDEEFTPKTEAVVVRAQSDAYFKLLGRKPQIKQVLQLGNYLVWMTPSGKALVIDRNNGQDKITDAEIDKLFVSRK